MGGTTIGGRPDGPASAPSIRSAVSSTTSPTATAATPPPGSAALRRAGQAAVTGWRLPGTTPGLLTVLSWTAVLLVAAVTAAMAVSVSATRAAADAVAAEAAPQVEAASELYFALGDMDAQAARMIIAGTAGTLPGQDPQPRVVSDAEVRASTAASGYSSALNVFNDRRDDVGDLLRRVTDGTDGDQAASTTATRVLDGLLRYHALTAQANGVVGRGFVEAGRDPGTADQPLTEVDTSAVSYYGAATNLMHGTVMVHAQSLVDHYENAFDQAQETHQRASIVGGVVLLVGVALLLGVLITLQVVIGRRFRRRVNPWLAAATVVALAVPGTLAGILTVQGERLQTARTQDFEAYLAVSRARAAGHEATADQSRAFVAEHWGARYREAFTQRTAQLVGEDLAVDQPGAFDALTEAAAAYAADPGDIRVGGALGEVMAGAEGQLETTLAREALDRYRVYQDGDRALAGADLGTAVAELTGVGRQDIGFTSYDYDLRLERLAGHQLGSFNATMEGVRGALGGWTAVPAVFLAVGVTLLWLGVRPRLAEYR
ncbi:hypothetical protein [Allostreptomyces psammosilenae]|uniref:Uncharacterized protein n=1 Tax=Allostreptomyces psammosilenae TaxID=1892865 RepID=A0A852ZYD9_9ACTN|nr:hypothetical protein [Allostreptomyces psammosilenae]NYI03292.1 hypothetical protein [Allostreptomyces psammosilenae]